MPARLRNLWIGPAAGLTAGLTAFVLDVLLADACLGYRLQLRPRHLLAYLLLGAAAGSALLVLVGLARLVPFARRPFSGVRPSPGRIFAGTLCLLYAAPIFERVDYAVGFRSPPWTGVVGAIVTLTLYGMWTALLSRLTTATAGPLLAALTAAVGLAVNRNLVDRPAELRALLADAATLAGILALAFAVRLWRGLRGGRRAAAAAGLVLALGIGLAVGMGVGRPGERITPAGTAAPGSPDLVLVILDTLRQDVFRDVVDTTEEGRRFHRALDHAVWFDQAIAAAPWTAPSVGSMLTGLYPVEHGFGRHVGGRDTPFPRMDRSVQTLAQFLGNRGYQTAGLVTNALLHPASGIGRGFQRYEILPAATHKLPILLALVRAGWLDHDLYPSADAARRVLERRLTDWIDPDRPFFFWLHLMDPHAPLHPHPDLADDPAMDRLPEDERLYRGETRFVLRELTRWLEEQQRSRDLWSHTLLVIVADHGEMFPSDGHFNGVEVDGEPKLRGHGHAFYDELVHVPLVIRPPGGAAAERRVGALVSQVDLFPTLVARLGLEVPERLASRVRFDRWLGPDPPSPDPGATDSDPEVRRQAVVSMNQRGPLHRALRTSTRKLIHYPGGERPDELYDLSRDPRERHDLAPERPQELAAAVALLSDLWSRLQPAASTRPVELDPETRRQLRALGYL